MATVFVGGSALLLAGAMAALAFGFANGEESLVWTALVASAAAAVFLVIAYVISKRDLRRAAPERPSASDPATTPASESSAEATEEAEQGEAERDEARAAGAGDRPDAATETTEEEGDRAVAGGPATTGTAGLTTGNPAATKPATPKTSSAPGTAGAGKPNSPTDTVVGVRTKKKFHRTECRYAKSESAEEMTRAAARKRGFSPCGICKP